MGVFLWADIGVFFINVCLLIHFFKRPIKRCSTVCVVHWEVTECISKIYSEERGRGGYDTKEQESNQCR